MHCHSCGESFALQCALSGCSILFATGYRCFILHFSIIITSKHVELNCRCNILLFFSTQLCTTSRAEFSSSIYYDTCGHILISSQELSTSSIYFSHQCLTCIINHSLIANINIVLHNSSDVYYIFNSAIGDSNILKYFGCIGEFSTVSCGSLRRLTCPVALLCSRRNPSNSRVLLSR